MDFVRPYFFVERRKNIVDLTYQNNKGLYAFVLAFMVILAVFLPTTSSYAADFGVGSPTGDFKVVQLRMKTTGPVTYFDGKVYGLSVPTDQYLLKDSPENYKQYMGTVTLRNMTTNQFYKVTTIQGQNAYATGKRVVLTEYVDIPKGTPLEFTYQMTKLLPKEAHGYNIYDGSVASSFISSSFTKTAPLPPQENVKVPVEVQKVKDLPATLGKVAGIATLAGCLILGTLLAVGSVRRLISLFIR